MEFRRAPAGLLCRIFFASSVCHSWSRSRRGSYLSLQHGKPSAEARNKWSCSRACPCSHHGHILDGHCFDYHGQVLFSGFGFVLTLTSDRLIPGLLVGRTIYTFLRLWFLNSRHSPLTSLPVIEYFCRHAGVLRCISKPIIGLKSLALLWNEHEFFLALSGVLAGL